MSTFFIVLYRYILSPVSHTPFVSTRYLPYPSSHFPLSIKHLEQVGRTINKSIPRLNKKSHNLNNTAQEDHSPDIRQRWRSVVDINDIVNRSANEVASRKGVESGIWKTGEVASQDCGGKESDVLEAVGLGAFGADDALFSLLGC